MQLLVNIAKDFVIPVVSLFDWANNKKEFSMILQRMLRKFAWLTVTSLVLASATAASAADVVDLEEYRGKVVISGFLGILVSSLPEIISFYG